MVHVLYYLNQWKLYLCKQGISKVIDRIWVTCMFSYTGKYIIYSIDQQSWFYLPSSICLLILSSGDNHTQLQMELLGVMWFVYLYFSFPGGMMDKSDPDLVYTALRETEEEVGLPASVPDIWGQLSALPSRVILFFMIWSQNFKVQALHRLFVYNILRGSISTCYSTWLWKSIVTVIFVFILMYPLKPTYSTK